MARTLKQDVDEEDRENWSDIRANLEDLPDELALELANIARVVPDKIKPDAKSNRRAIERQVFTSNLSDLLSIQAGSSLNEVSAALQELNEANVATASPEDINRILAQASIVQANALRGILETNITQAVFLDTIATAVDSPSSITVSGTNSIDNADSPEPVVPESGDKSIPARKLYVRADESNTDKIYFGDNDVAPDDGFMLKKGESEIVPIDLRDTALWMASGTAGQEVQLMGVF